MKKYLRYKEGNIDASWCNGKIYEVEEDGSTYFEDGYRCHPETLKTCLSRFDEVTEEEFFRQEEGKFMVPLPNKINQVYIPQIFN